jgi:hypothetical protein
LPRRTQKYSVIKGGHLNKIKAKHGRRRPYRRPAN